MKRGVFLFLMVMLFLPALRAEQKKSDIIISPTDHYVGVILEPTPETQFTSKEALLLANNVAREAQKTGATVLLFHSEMNPSVDLFLGTLEAKLGDQRIKSFPYTEEEGYDTKNLILKAAAESGGRVFNIKGT